MIPSKEGSTESLLGRQQHPSYFTHRNYIRGRSQSPAPQRSRRRRDDQEPHTYGVTYVDSEGRREPLARLRFPTPSRDATPATRRRVNIDERETEGEYLEGEIESKKKKKQRRKKKFKKPPKEEPESKEEEVVLSSEEPDLGETGLEYNCLVAKTSLILGFTWKTPLAPERSVDWIKKLKERTFTDASGEKIQLWLNKDRLPYEVADFTPQFRQVIGWHEDSKRYRDLSNQTWTCQRLLVNPIAVKKLFANAKITTIQGDTQVNYDATFEGIELLVYPLGSAILVFHINWLNPDKRDGDKTVGITLDDIRTILFVAKYRQKVSQLCLGWSFMENPVLEKELHPKHLECLGSDMKDIKYCKDKTLSLSAIGNWLIHLPEEDPSAPSLLLDYSRHAYHHSTIVIDKEPSQELLQEYLFHLRRAFGQKNRPPPNPETSLGSVLAPRRNRYIGISREGTVCVSWPINPDDPKDFELVKWHNKFQGVYLLLGLHVHGERQVLLELSDLAAAQAENIKIVAQDVSLEEIKKSRQVLRELAAMMVRYTLSMSSGDCGGSSEYSEFFVTIREVFGITELRAELSTELKDVLAVVESHYLEEERRQRDEAEAKRAKERERQTLFRRQKDEQDQRFNLLLTLIGSFTLPFVLVSGVLGMNLDNLPTGVDFWTLMYVTLAISIILFGVLMLWRYYNLKRNIRGLRTYDVPLL